MKAPSAQDIAEMLSRVVGYIADHVARNRDFWLSAAVALVFFQPALRSGGIEAGFLYMGDVVGFYVPGIAKTKALISSLNFTALDYSSFNGSTDFFLAPNFYACHPLIVAYGLFGPAKATLREIGLYLVLVLVFHSFLACYFSLKVLQRFFQFDFAVAAIAATAFTVNVLVVSALGEPQFIFSVAVIPWVIYGSLAFSAEPTVRRLLLASVPSVFALLGGYVPLAAAGLGLSVVLVASQVLYIDESAGQRTDRIRRLLLAALPYGVAALVVSPYFFAVFTYLRDTPSAHVTSLFYSAHQYAELPQSFLRLVSSRLPVPGPFYEFSISWGIVATCVGVLFVFGGRTLAALTPQELRTFKVAALVYFATVLATYGEHSVVSDLVYYLVPQIGKMHIYQRFFLPAHLVFAIMLALMLKAVVTVRPPLASRALVAILVLLALAMSTVMNYNQPLTHEVGLNNHVLFELLLGVLFALLVLIPGSVYVYGGTLVLLALPPLDQMYDFSHGKNSFLEQRKLKTVALDENERKKLVSYLKTWSGNKDVIKYVDITPRWFKLQEGVETFPKSFPYFVLRELNLSSYSGFNFYLSARADYMSRMPLEGAAVKVDPDWELLANTGADFLVALEADLKVGALGELFREVRQEELHRLPNGVVVAPLGQLRRSMLNDEPVLFDNGFFKITRSMIQDEPIGANIALGKPVRQSSEGGGGAELAVDGNTSGEFSLGSVTHTSQDPNAWFEIDLGQVEAIDRVVIWNRTDCCPSRLRDYYLFVSEVPFGANDTAEALRSRSGTWSKINLSPKPRGTTSLGGVRGRYIRIQLGGGQLKEDAYLSLAEVQVFRAKVDRAASSSGKSAVGAGIEVKEFHANYANFGRIEFEASIPTTVHYLFWNNPRLRFYLNGDPAKIVERQDLVTIDVPSGRNSVEVRYRHWPLIVFWGFLTAYLLAMIWALMPPGWGKTIRTKFHSHSKGSILRRT